MDNRIFGIDLYRAAAILMVLAAQCVFFFPQEDGAMAQLAGLAGFLGLEIFLVLSGFLAGKSLYRLFCHTEFDFRSMALFSAKRKIRIVPLYYLVLCALLAVAYFRNYPVEGAWKYFFLLQNFASSIPAFFPESWGLPVILYSGILLLLLLVGLQKLLSHAPKPMVFLLVALLPIVLCLGFKWIYNMGATHTDVNAWDASLKTVVIYRLDAFFIGVFFSWLQSFVPNVFYRMRWLFAAVGCVGILFIIAGVGYFRLLIDTHPFFWNVFYLPITSLALACFFPVLSVWQTVPKMVQIPIGFISRTSYAVYLIHYSVLIQLLEYFLMANFAQDNSQLAEFSLIYLASNLVLAALLFYAVERPFIRKASSLKFTPKA